MLVLGQLPGRGIDPVDIHPSGPTTAKPSRAHRSRRSLPAPGSERRLPANSAVSASASMPGTPQRRAIVSRRTPLATASALTRRNSAPTQNRRPKNRPAAARTVGRTGGLRLGPVPAFRRCRFSILCASQAGRLPNVEGARPMKRFRDCPLPPGLAHRPSCLRRKR